MASDSNSINLKHSQLNHADKSPVYDISDQYVCHLWTKTGHLIMATEEGDLLLLNYSGELLERIETSPGDRIVAMTEFSRGVIVGGENG